MSSNNLVFKRFSIQVIFSIVWPSLTKARLRIWKHVPGTRSNLSRWKYGPCMKCRSWWSLTTWYSKVFHLKSSHGSFDQVWPKSKLWVWQTHTLSEPWMPSNGKLMNTKFVILIKTYIFSNGHIFIWKILDHSILKFERIHSCHKTDQIIRVQVQKRSTSNQVFILEPI